MLFVLKLCAKRDLQVGSDSLTLAITSTQLIHMRFLPSLPGRVVMVCKESYLPYDRVKVSTDTILALVSLRATY